MTSAARPWPPVQHFLVFLAVLSVILLGLRVLGVPMPWWRPLITVPVAALIALGIERWWRRR